MTARVRWQTFSGSTGWYECEQVTFAAPGVLILIDVTAGRYRDEELTATDRRDLAIPWHDVRGLVEVIHVESDTCTCPDLDASTHTDRAATVKGLDPKCPQHGGRS